MSEIDFKQAIPVPENLKTTKEIISKVAVLGETYLQHHEVVREEFSYLIEQLYKRLSLLEAVYIDGRQDGYIDGQRSVINSLGFTKETN